MIVDFSKLYGDAAFEADVCVIGTGPAGLALAREFIGTSARVIVLESGGLGFERAAAALNAGQSVGLHHTGLTAGRRRQFAGAANIWGAVCVELDPSDFERRPWVSNSGWPLSASDVAPFYDRARAFFKLERTNYGADDWRALGMSVAPFDSAVLSFSVAPTTPATDLGNVYRAAFRDARSPTVLLHATATELRTNADGNAIERVVFRSRGGKRGTVRARAVVLACGGIENARLLLLSRDQHAAGLGNGYDLVGRYLSDHTLTRSARIAPAPHEPPRAYFGGIRSGGISLRPRFSLPFATQAAAGVPAAMAQVHFAYPPDSGLAAAMSLRRAIRFRRMPERLARDVFNVMRYSRELAALAIDRYGRGKHPAPESAAPWLECVTEQIPDPESRVTLGTARDGLGLPLPVIDWRAAEDERRSIAALTAGVAREFARLGLGSLEPEPWLCEPGSAWQRQLVEGFHHMGTTRMAAAPRTGVVDATCGVHGVAGLYAAGSSVFPAAGYANPTLTIVALAIRLADHLKRELRRPAYASIAPGTAATLKV